ncbi:MAG: CHAD domain-containing protein [Chlorobium sp.]|nr:MAG: CHAD domain-containing protein [Chlorobium sp.]
MSFLRINIPKTVYFKLDGTVALETLPESIQHSLPVEWSLKQCSSLEERRYFYDTFQWQAFDKETVIVKKKNLLSLVNLNTGHEITSAPFKENPASFFPEALPDCKLKEELYSYSTLRAFIKLCSIHVFTRLYQLLDENKKTIATLSLESLYPAGNSKEKALIHFFSITPNRGYEKAIATFEGLLKENSLIGKRFDYKALFLSIINTSGHNVDDYSPKIRLQLDPNASIHESAIRLLKFTVSIMRRNEDGIRKNIDSEFLHDYRVAIRRTRSILKQLKGVFDAGETEYFLNAFRDLGKRTNELRDSDVYLLREGTYLNYLPPFLRPSLGLFFNEIENVRRKSHKQFCSYLSSPEYHSFLLKWETYLCKPSYTTSKEAPNASRATLSFAVDTLKKAWKKVIRHGRLISKEATDAELHGLRIDCKKLRYLLEFFASVFPDKTITPVIQKLKKLQEQLGDVVDYGVQLNFLHHQLTVMAADKLLAASTGGLMASLFQHQQQARLKFHKTFCAFDNEETNQLFHDLLTGAEL